MSYGEHKGFFASRVGSKALTNEKILPNKWSLETLRIKRLNSQTARHTRIFPKGLEEENLCLMGDG